MRIPVKNKKLILLSVGLVSGLLCSVVVFWELLGTVWTRIDFQALDGVYQQAVKYGYAPVASPQIVYVSLTSETYQTWGKNVLDRAMMARVNTVLTEAKARAIVYDIIFARPSDPEADRQLAASIATAGNVYLPIGFEPSERQGKFTWETGAAYARLKAWDLKQPLETGRARPVYALKALMSLDAFAEAAHGAGHITAPADPDGVYRHLLLLIKVDALYIPTLSLAVFLDDVGVTFDQVTVNWGHEIRIPATPDSYLDQDVVIPIDEQGRAFIPFPHKWGEDFANKYVHTLLKDAEDPRLQGNLEDFFGGRFVLIDDASQDASDVGQTPLGIQTPLVSLHAALLNGLLTNTFYRKWTSNQVLLLVSVLAMILLAASLLKSPWVLYAAGGVLLIGLVGLTWQQFIHFVLFPVLTVTGSVFWIFTGLVLGLQVAIARQESYLRDAFARYVPTTVVEELLRHPEKLTLGGEERVLTVLFADVHGFTTISEQLPPKELVQLLNAYLSEMTQIILAEGGIIDKYQGDAIMAEFGVPLPLPQHADAAVAAALKMQRRLRELRQQWAAQKVPELRCRIGINTGTMIVGNMGSDRVFDYTVIGDAVNLAARLESANKFYHTFLMISESTYHALTPNRFRTRPLDLIKVKGKSEAVKVFEVYGTTSEPVTPGDVTYYQAYQAGLDAYLTRDFTRARAHFASALQARSDDLAASTLLTRMASLNPDGLPENWDGAVALNSK